MSRELENAFRAELETSIGGFGLEQLTGKQTDQLVKHYALLRRWNQRMNLTRIIEPRKAARLHYAESLFGAKFISGARTVLDIGSGAGFPAIPLAVARADVRITALEANQKKALFLREVKDELGLDNFKVANARLEEFDLSGYDVLTSRALDRAEFVLPPIIGQMRSNQRLMLYCGLDLVTRLEASQNCVIKTHPIPHSDARAIAIFTSK